MLTGRCSAEECGNGGAAAARRSVSDFIFYICATDFTSLADYFSVVANAMVLR